MPSDSMNVINFNRNQLPQRDKFANRLGGYNSSKKTEYNLPKATTKQLKEIARRLKEEQKIRMIKVVALTVILFLGLVYAILY
ncbi:hypothetical protein [Winogradskyella flava]|uniref:Uncharacterized protein n=1 Tax=Winogradskyella flava TaxID=1884876 RepID=A0A842ISX7_9FLAO|nr:hypothetical protein [Winogradskyella flava]MBC2844527.1 hypothetical protein [Winogradskyella flava]